MDIIIDGKDETLRRIAELYRLGQPPRVICPVCSVEVVVRFVKAGAGHSSNKSGIASIHCPSDREHVLVTGEADPNDFWAEFRRNVERRRQSHSE